MIRWVVTAPLVAALLSGCAAMLPVTDELGLTKRRDAVCLPVAQAEGVLATLRTIYRRVAPVALAKCQDKTLTAAQCQALYEANEALKALGFEAERIVHNPGVAVDWLRVNQYLAVIIGAAL